MTDIETKQGERGIKDYNLHEIPEIGRKPKESERWLIPLATKINEQVPEVSSVQKKTGEPRLPCGSGT